MNKDTSSLSFIIFVKVSLSSISSPLICLIIPYSGTPTISALSPEIASYAITPVSYTHLDVYKRQVLYPAKGKMGFKGLTSPCKQNVPSPDHSSCVASYTNPAYVPQRGSKSGGGIGAGAGASK